MTNLGWMGMVFVSMTALNVHAKETVWDCSPTRAMGYYAAQEKIYLRMDGRLAQYEYSSAGSAGVSYKVALAPSLFSMKSLEGQDVEASDGLFTGIGRDGEEIQLTFTGDKESAPFVLFSRSLSSRSETYPCSQEKRSEVDWTEAEAAITSAPQNGGSTLFSVEGSL